MNTRLFPLSILLLLGGAACKDDGPSFLSIATLCQRYADDVCAARELCCDVSDSSACLDMEKDYCTASSDAREQDGAFGYDSEHASSVLADQREQLDECGAPFSVGRFFEGTLSDGSACESDAQCQSDYCDLEQSVCASNPELLLCPGEGPEQEITPET